MRVVFSFEAEGRVIAFDRGTLELSIEVEVEVEVEGKILGLASARIGSSLATGERVKLDEGGVRALHYEAHHVLVEATRGGDVRHVLHDTSNLGLDHGCSPVRGRKLAGPSAISSPHAARPCGAVGLERDELPLATRATGERPVGLGPVFPPEGVRVDQRRRGGPQNLTFGCNGGAGLASAHSEREMHSLRNHTPQGVTPRGASTMEKRNDDVSQKTPHCACNPCSCAAPAKTSAPATRGCGCGCSGEPCACGDECPSRAGCDC